LRNREGRDTPLKWGKDAAVMVERSRKKNRRGVRNPNMKKRQPTFYLRRKPGEKSLNCTPPSGQARERNASCSRRASAVNR